MSAHLLTGEVVAIAGRCYLTRGDGESVLYGVRTTDGRFVKASLIRWAA